MSFSILASFWLVSFLLVIVPGMDWAYAISAGIRGKTVVAPAVSGMLLGHLAVTGLVAAGVGAIVADIPYALDAVTLVGAGYLLWLGVGMIRHPVSPLAEFSNAPDRSMQWIVKGIGVSGLNPKVFLLFLALFPQFADPASSWPLSVQMLTLGGIHLVSCGAVYLLVGYSSQAVLQTRPEMAQRVSQLSGFCMMAIAGALLVELVVQHS